MNYEIARNITRVQSLIEELSAYSRPISYNLNEIKVIPMLEHGEYKYLIIWRKDGQKK